MKKKFETTQIIEEEGELYQIGLKEVSRVKITNVNKAAAVLAELLDSRVDGADKLALKLAKALDNEKLLV